MIGFSYNGRHSEEFHIKAIKTNRVLFPAKKHTFIDIPFKDGSVLLPDNTSMDITIPIECMLQIPNGVSIYDIGRSISNWLNQSDWKKLIFDDDPNYYYNAICTSTITVEDIKTGIFTIEYRCKPQQLAVI